MGDIWVEFLRISRREVEMCYLFYNVFYKFYIFQDEKRYYVLYKLEKIKV